MAVSIDASRINVHRKVSYSALAGGVEDGKDSNHILNEDRSASATELQYIQTAISHPLLYLQVGTVAGSIRTGKQSIPQVSQAILLILLFCLYKRNIELLQNTLTLRLLVRISFSCKVHREVQITYILQTPSLVEKGLNDH